MTSKGKEERFLPVLTKYALGLIWHADTLDVEFEAELLSFPEASHDDWVDALVYAVSAVDSSLRHGWSRSSGAQWEKYLSDSDDDDDRDTYNSIMIE